MGLAASQARFLAITARKAQCEMQSMQIAQDKLSISNELTTATQQYQNALNATKLIWDSDGTGNHMYDVSYGLLMSPSAANMYDPYLVTDRSGRIALNSKMAKAAQAAGIDPKGGTPANQAGRDAFIQALAEAGAIAGSTANAVTSNAYSSSAGVGGVPLDKTAANAISNETLANLLSDEAYNLNLEQFISGGSNQFANGFSSDKKAANSLTLAVNNATNPISSQDTFNNLTIGDLLNNEYTLVFALPDGVDPNVNDENSGMMANFVKNIISGENSLFSQIVEQLTLLLGIDEASNEALDYATKKIIQSYTANRAINAGAPGSTKSSFSNATSKANEFNAITYTTRDNLKGSENSHIAINLSNLVSSFLTYYAEQLTNNDYAVTRIEENSYYVTDDMTFMYELQNPNAITEKDLLVTDFYNSLYNNICANGWTGAYGDNLEDNDFLQNAMKNGQLFVSTLGADGYYYQQPYGDTGYLIEVTDDDAIAQAELEYEIQKSKLNAKEEKLDLDMKNVDMEISSLTTEYDTVKNLISKNVEKVFTMFQS